MLYALSQMPRVCHDGETESDSGYPDSGLMDADPLETHLERD